MNHEQLWLTGCLLAATGVGFGSILGNRAHYQILHSVGILVSLSLRARQRLGPGASGNYTSVASPLSLVPGHLFTAGIAMFSGSIYCLVLNPVKFRWMGPVTPLGGLCMIAGWVALGVAKSGELDLWMLRSRPT
ncbi:hypothetical protein BCR44DRAFT_1429940 [Catenaria anguillulae PL171]|uniref:DUF423-domain-containing protein n=1 Tax=Catenaria anguillulae PL171 TaxID=765915 RepID=A0A1Y2HVQ5_9FUNG|nr:hypothetical protein BCR44DRAFT_1429940 [Catenaria anguillulae PL171]